MSSSSRMDPVADLLGGGRTIAYKTDLAHVTGSVTAGLLLSQFWYWSNLREVTEQRDGWFWKTAENIREETGLGRYELEMARKRLRELDLLEESRCGVPAKLWYRVNKGSLYRLLLKYVTNQIAGFQQSETLVTSNQELRKPPNKAARKPESISEKTQRRLREDNNRASRETSSPCRTTTTLAHSAAAAVDSALVEELVCHDMNRSDAIRLAQQYPDECRCQLAYLPYKTNGFSSGQGAYLRAAIEGGYAPPKGYKDAQRKQEDTAKKAEMHQAREASIAAERTSQLAFEAALEEARSTLRADPAVWEQIHTEARDRLPTIVRDRPSNPAFQASLDAHIAEIVAQRSGLRPPKSESPSRPT